MTVLEAAEKVREVVDLLEATPRIEHPLWRLTRVQLTRLERDVKKLRHMVEDEKIRRMQAETWKKKKRTRGGS